jgi:predicted permease
LVFQTAFSVVLLVGAGLFVRSLQQVRAVRLGYDVNPLVYVSTTMRGVKLKTPEMAALVDRLLQEARAVPGIRGATFAVTIPFLGGERHTLYVPGMDSVQQLGRFMLQAGSPGYFATMGTRIVRGRDLSRDDRAGAPLVAVVSEAMANVLWKDENAIGKCFRIEADTVPCTTVVGIAENIKARNIGAGGEFMYYLPVEQYFATIGSPDGAQLIVRAPTSSAAYVETVRARLQRVMPGASYVTAMSFHDVTDPTFRSWESGTRMFLILGGLALLIAAIGLYAAIAFAVAQRRQEIGVRIALGARANEIVQLVVGDGIRVTLGGIALGTLIGLVASRQIGGLLFNERPSDPLVYGTVAGVLIVVSILASTIPARRAARVEPSEALRAE